MIYARRYKFIRILFVSENTCLYVFAVAISGIFVFVRVACVRDESRGAERALWHLIKISLNFLRFFPFIEMLQRMRRRQFYSSLFMIIIIIC